MNYPARCALTALFICLIAQNSASGILVDLDSLQHGTIVTNQFQLSQGLTISAVNHTGPDAALVFNSNVNNTADPDLESPFTRGNLAPGLDIGNILIIAENVRDNNNDGLVDSPDDEGSRPAGSLNFVFDQVIDSFGFDLIDVEGPQEFGQDSGFVATFFSGVTELTRVGFGSFVDPGASFYDPSVEFGNHSANRIDPITAEALQITPFDRVEVNFGGSAGIANIRFKRPTFETVTAPVPEPQSWLLMVFAVSLLLIWRRHRAITG